MRAALALALLWSSSGCFMIGTRLMEGSWAPVQTQAAAGLHVPIPVGEDAILSVEGFAGGAASGSDEAVIQEASLGAAYLLGGSTPYWRLEGGVMNYVGAGMSMIDASLTRGGLSDRDTTYAPFVYWGAWLHEGLQVLGVEVRYTFWGELDLHGSKERVNNLMVLLVLLVDT